MNVARTLRDARELAGLSQRELARRTAVAQPTIARIERGQVDPRVGTLDRLLAACDFDLALAVRGGQGVDRTQIRELLRMTPAQRLETLRRDVEGLTRFERARRLRPG